ncbi:CopD family protein [Alloacidobacterium dinghuense]|uniref:CopD family protein n=1 Tax=Alloacidobacterium dinghuense TaxID=2763107 RepID=A0A7G8BJT1_9BACT|nr:CopD family protein [Alloacidobacterium dinghuense]QNI32801.1 CopD family protein [Alloacidobacterium dinghuense]
MIWLLKDFDLLSVLLRAAGLALEALTLGGVSFLLLAALPARLDAENTRRLRIVTGWAALALAVAQVLSVATGCTILISGSGFSFRDVATADFFFLGFLLFVSALALFALMRATSRRTLFACAPFAIMVLMASVGMSHAAARLENRWILLALTTLHHVGTAAWIGAMPFLLIALRGEKSQMTAGRYARRFSAMAITSVSLLVLGGIGMAFFYIGSWQGIYGTTYGIMIVAKIYLLLLILGMGAGNFFLVRQIDRAPAPLLVRLRRFSEAEIGLGFTAILAAASLTSQPPAVDLTRDRLTSHEIVERMRWVLPRMSSPPLKALVPPSSIQVAIQNSLFGSGSENDANDRAWSEYNHHWAGLIVLVAGLLALLARSERFKWAHHWPLLFIGLAAFILLRADPENWPLGPRPFWASFSSPDVLQHRMYAVLITAFAVFEWAVETGRVKSRRASYVFPLMCAAGGALLLTHSHALGNIKEEMLAEMSHTPIALLGATAGWSRWLELRLSQDRDSKIASYVWPVCLVLVGIVLLDYRES